MENSKFEALQIAGRMFVRETKADGTVTETEVLPADTIVKKMGELEEKYKATSEPETKETATAETKAEEPKQTLGDKLKRPIVIGLGIAGAVIFGKKYQKNATSSATASTDVSEPTTVDTPTTDEVPE